MVVRVPLRIAAVFLVVALACAHGPKGGGLGLPGAVDFETHDRRLAFRLKPTDDGLRVEDGAGDLLAAVRMREGSLAIEDAQSRLLGFVRPPSDQDRAFLVLAPDGRRVLFELHIEPDGDLKVFDGNDELVCQAKRRAYGFKLLNRDGEVESRIRLGSNKISVHDASGVTFLFTRDPLSLESVAMIMLDEVRFEHAVGLAVAMTYWRLKAD